MARQLVPTLKPTQGRVSASEVPEDVQNDLEESYEYLRTNPGTEITASFEDKKELLLFVRQARTWAETRPAGPLRFRRMPRKNLAENVMVFNITADLEEGGKRNAKSEKGQEPGPKRGPGRPPKAA